MRHLARCVLSQENLFGPGIFFVGLLLLLGDGSVCHAETPWYERCLVGMEVGPTGAQFGSDATDRGYAARFDGREIVRKCVAAHAEYLVIWARDGAYAYYDSKLQPKAPGLEDRDILRETMDEAKVHELPVIAYCVLQYPTHALKQHPEWRMQDENGRAIDGRVCFNSPYVDHVKGLLAEMLGYGIDGFHLDMVDQGFGPPYGCWCENCRERFSARFQRSMPEGVAWDEDWDRMLAFRYETSDEFEEELTAYVKRIRPGATVDFNYHGNPPFSWEVGQRPVQHAENADFVTGETGVWGFSALTVGLNAEFYRAATPGEPVQVAIQRGVRMYHDQTTRPLADIRWELFSLLAHGAFVTMVDKTAYDGWLDPVAYERIGLAFREARAKREHFGHRPVCEAGLYFSSRTRDWYGREDAGRYFQSFQGVQKAMVYEHVPWGVLLDENVTPDRLRRFPVVVLPNTGILSDEEVELLTEYVRGGGRLIVTGITATLDRHGRDLEQTMLAELIGANLIGRLDSQDNWMRLGPADLETGAVPPSLRADWPLLVKGPAVIYEPTTARPLGSLLKPHRTVRQRQGNEGTSWPMSADKPVGPAMLLNSVGEGRVLTFSGSPDFATASEHHIVEARRLLTHAVGFLSPKPRATVTAPANVEAVVTDDPEARVLRVHLLAYNSPPQTTPLENRPYVLPMPMEEAPMYRVTISSTSLPKDARAWNETTELKCGGHQISAVVEDVHEIIWFRY